MLEALIALAGNTVVAAATDAWEAARRKFAQLLGRGDPNKEQLVGRRQNDTCQQLGRISDQELEKVQADLGKVWQVRIADLLEEDPGVEAELRALVEEVPGAAAGRGGVGGGSCGRGRAGCAVRAEPGLEKSAAHGHSETADMHGDDGTSDRADRSSYLAGRRVARLGSGPQVMTLRDSYVLRRDGQPRAVHRARCGRSLRKMTDR